MAAKRFEQIATGVTLFLGDCRDLLPGLSADAVVTDPPYGMGANTNYKRFSGGSSQTQKKRSGGGAVYASVVGDNEPFHPRPILEFSQVIVWGFNHFSERLPRGGGLVWLKRNDDAFGSFLSDAELGWEKGKVGVACFRSLPQALATERYHPTQKPVDLMIWCIQRTRGTVLDPYMGSGTTGVAAVKLGRRFIGVEKVESYFDIACSRITATTRQPDLFERAKPVEQECLDFAALNHGHSEPR